MALLEGARSTRVVRPGRPQDCHAPGDRGTSPTDALLIAEAAREPELYTVDLNPALCPSAPLCQAVVDGEIVWRDDHHVTARFAQARRQQVWRLIRRTGVLSAQG